MVALLVKKGTIWGCHFFSKENCFKSRHNNYLSNVQPELVDHVKLSIFRELPLPINSIPRTHINPDT